MNKNNTAYLYNKYSKLYSQHSLTEDKTNMCYGFQCCDGWFDLIIELSKKLVKLSPAIEAMCVKEKFGVLRFYVDGSKLPEKLMEKAHALIMDYENKSYTICEVCGKRGELVVVDGWRSILCKKCKNNAIKTRKGNIKFTK